MRGQEGVVDYRETRLKTRRESRKDEREQRYVVSLRNFITMIGVIGAAVHRCFAQLRLLISSSIPTLEEYAEADRADRLAKFHFINALQEIDKMRVFFGLRIPNAQGKERTEIDVVILTKRKLYVVEIIYWVGRVNLEVDGSWQQILVDATTIKHPNIVKETQKRAALLELYLSQRGLKVPASFLEYKVLLASPQCRADKAILLQREVLSIEEWDSFLAKETKKGMCEWMKLIRAEQKKVLPKDLRKQLYFILGTAPTWDRLLLVGGSTVFGDFLEFKGGPEDMDAIKLITRSHVSHLKMTCQQKYTTGVPGFFVKKTVSEVEVSCTVRDFRLTALKRAKKGQMESTFHTKIRPDLKIIFRAVGATRTYHFKVKNVVSMHLTA